MLIWGWWGCWRLEHTQAPCLFGDVTGTQFNLIHLTLYRLLLAVTLQSSSDEESTFINTTKICYKLLEEQKFSVPVRAWKRTWGLIFYGLSKGVLEVLRLIVVILAVWHQAAQVFSLAVSDWCRCSLLLGHLPGLLSSPLNVPSKEYQ